MGQTSLTHSFPRPPRPVRRRHGLTSAILVRIVSLLMLGIFFIILGKFAADALIHFRGEPVTARVTRTWTTRGKSTHYHVAYNYNVNNQLFNDEDSISQGEFQRMSVGQAFPARTDVVLGHRAAALDLGDSSWWNRHTAYLFLGLMFAGISICLFIAAWLDPLRDRRALEQGDPVEGFIEDKFTRRTKNGRTYHIRFRYNLRPGESHSRKIKTTRAIFDATDFNQQLTIFLDPAKPRRGVALELCEFEIVTR